MKRMMFVFHGLLLISSVCFGAQRWKDLDERYKFDRAIRTCYVAKKIVDQELPKFLRIGGFIGTVLDLDPVRQVCSAPEIKEKKKEALKCAFSVLQDVAVVPYHPEELEFMDEFPEVLGNPFGKRIMHAQLAAWIKGQVKNKTLSEVDQQAYKVTRVLQPQIKENFSKIQTLLHGAQEPAELQQPGNMNRAIRTCILAAKIIQQELPLFLEGNTLKMHFYIRNTDKKKEAFARAFSVLQDVAVVPFNPEELEFMDKYPEIFPDPSAVSTMNAQMNAWFEDQARKNTLQEVEQKLEEMCQLLEPRTKETFKEMHSLFYRAQEPAESQQSCNLDRAITTCVVIRDIIDEKLSNLLLTADDQLREDMIQEAFVKVFEVIAADQTVPFSVEELDFMDKYLEEFKTPSGDGRSMIETEMSTWYQDLILKETLDAKEQLIEETCRTLEPKIQEIFRKK